MLLVAVSIVIGIPTVKRDSVSYVARTIDSLITGMTPEEQDDCLIVLFVAEVIGQSGLRAAFSCICRCHSTVFTADYESVYNPNCHFFFLGGGGVETPQVNWTLKCFMNSNA